VGHKEKIESLPKAQNSLRSV